MIKKGLGVYFKYFCYCVDPQKKSGRGICQLSGTLCEGETSAVFWMLFVLTGVLRPFITTAWRRWKLCLTKSYKNFLDKLLQLNWCLNLEWTFLTCVAKQMPFQMDLVGTLPPVLFGNASQKRAVMVRCQKLNDWDSQIKYNQASNLHPSIKEEGSRRPHSTLKWMSRIM